MCSHIFCPHSDCRENMLIFLLICGWDQLFHNSVKSRSDVYTASVWTVISGFLWLSHRTSSFITISASFYIPVVVCSQWAELQRELYTLRSRIVHDYIVPHFQLVLNCSTVYVLAYCSIKYYWNQLCLTTLMRWESHGLSSTLSWLTTREWQVKQGLEAHKSTLTSGRPTYRSQCPFQTMPHLYDCAPHRRKSWFYSDLLRSETSWESWE